MPTCLYLSDMLFFVLCSSLFACSSLCSNSMMVKYLTISIKRCTFAAGKQKKNLMEDNNGHFSSRDCIIQLISTRMASRQAMQRLLRDSGAGITFEMLQIMSCLWTEQGISQQTLAVRTSKDKACLTNLMLNLEKKGYVCRREDPKDKRNKLVYLTDEGEAFRRWISPKLSAYYTRLDEILGKDVIKQTEKLLKDLQHAIETY